MYEPHDILKQYWGYDGFRPLQEDIIQSILDGNDTLALLPTGGGKSICFQVPALAQEGLCIVISPLIALMKDQVYNLKKREISAEAIFSGMGKRQIDRILTNAALGKIKLLYLSPERLQSELFQERLKQMKVNFLAIDEAHCISQWGYDFRPAYLKIAEAREWMGNVPVLALTASATERVKQDIQDKLLFKANRHIYQKSFQRANLSYSIFEEENKMTKLLQVLKNVKGTGIVYVRSRKRTKAIAELLRKNRIKADFYHGGLDGATRSRKQDKWIKDKIRVMVCTNAFGMGIDKPDVRVVVHMDLPESLEAYYQEAGRGGRDEKKAYAVLLYNEADCIQLRKQLTNSFPEVADIKKTYQAIANFYQVAVGAGENQDFPLKIGEICKTYSIKPLTFFNSLKILSENHYLITNDSTFVPSRLIVRLDREELYKFEIANKKLEPYIKAILRTYGGRVFDEYVDIREAALAANYKVPTKYIVHALRLLHQQQVIDYVPQAEQPKIIFTRPRVDQSNLQLDTELMEFRKKVRTDNVEAVIAYTQNKYHCRSLELVRYYGELADERCGVCDLCLARKKLAVEADLLDKMVFEIKDLLNESPTEVKTLMGKLEHHPRPEVIKVLRWMRESHQLDVNEERMVFLM